MARHAATARRPHHEDREAARRPGRVQPGGRRHLRLNAAAKRGGSATGAIYLVTGAVRSGKSAFARRLAEAGAPPVTFLATLSPSDPELAARVARHRAERPPHWRTVEPPADVLAALAALAAHPGTLLLDSLGGLVAARVTALFGGSAPLELEPVLPDPAAAEGAEAAFLAELEEALAAAGAGPATLIVVAEQVGWDVVPPSPLARLFRDLLGLAAQRVAAVAAAAWLLVAGRALPLPPGTGGDAAPERP